MNQFHDSHIAAARGYFILKIPYDFRFQFPKRRTIPLAGRQSVSRLQPPAIYKLRLTVNIPIFEYITAILALALSIAKNTISLISSFFAHVPCSFPHEKEPRHDIQTVYHVRGFFPSRWRHYNLKDVSQMEERRSRNASNFFSLDQCFYTILYDEIRCLVFFDDFTHSLFANIEVGDSLINRQTVLVFDQNLW